MGVKMTKRLFEAADMFRFEYMPEAQLSPDGTKIVYVLLRTDEAKDSEFSNLWLMDVQSKAATQLTNGEWTDNSPVWSPDGQHRLPLHPREEAADLFVFACRQSNSPTHELFTRLRGRVDLVA
jgi:dipeptidyl aminopeptidase/acylaminoacyl peptidase